ncbi:alpha/beta-hydrolase [Cristinia sonorae]|uniref:Carboxypeptidase n=1 Tax=Cristinia sonorae TaxID=1940300 RepID=A0A8K0UE52_9AGAR|nr:alpha/beta-hydrolase [Cristinia sonorae]
MLSVTTLVASLAAASFTLVLGQRGVQPPSFPHDYPGKPSGDLSPAWQSYFQVTEKLPNITFDLGRNWAGSIPVGRAGRPNNTLFFWAFEKENGSLTAAAGERSDEPWGIWLNGGPGSSSMLGMMFENGPVHIADDYSAFANNFSWNHLADYIWVDQPVGTGFSTVDAQGMVKDEDEMGQDFMGFLANLVKVFPSLKTRPFYLTGESYAGTYIPYITKTYFGLTDPPVNLRKIAIGDGTLGSGFVFEQLPTMQVIETYPQLIGYDPEVFNYFQTQSHLCGYDLNLTYPQESKFPTLNPPFTDLSDAAKAKSRIRSKTALLAETHARFSQQFSKLDDGEGTLSRRDLDEIAQKRDAWIAEKRDLSGRDGNATVADSFYGCFIYDELLDYAVNFSLPWSMGVDHNDNLDVYNIPDALSPEAPMEARFFFNNASARAALHAPTSKNWTSSVNYRFGGPRGQDPSVEPMAFLDELATNATLRNVSIVIYSGNDDSLVAHRGSEVVIQNTTFGGIQGFTRKPSTPWFDDNGEFAGIVHQERNWTFVLISGAGHLVPQQQPGRAFVFLREFVLGNNETGLVTNTSGTVSVVGGESTTIFVNDILPGQDGIYAGSGTTQSTYTYPSATVAAFASFTATALPSVSAATGSNGTGGGTSSQQSAAGVGVEKAWVGVEAVVAVLSVLVVTWVAV